ncbi:sulfurtransferase TusA family protein [Sedimenticola thiotaurini]|uniref:SirA family protein n=1 Tax=Sedimenticola thiotaurini TaxID=1543721 RepID=A0A0F7JZK7_9GAMM|nr:sulfurtransferase TusA family protein [Sedimenticola thiotaurini]AKH21097.1 SirA family protein [Sedimenticola thiotaurini]
MKPVIVDARRLLCPMPVIRVQDRVKELAPGTRVEAVCTDPGALNDIPAWCRINGHKLIETRTEDNEYIIVVEVGEDN